MSNPGLGSSGFGSSLYGYGTPTIVNSTTAKLLRKSDGSQGNVPLVDPDLGDFILDANGNHLGDSSINQMVYLALRTQLNSSAVLGFGLDLASVKTITQNVQLKITVSVNKALQDMVNNKLIAVNQVNVKLVKPSGISIYVAWTDLTSNEQNTTKLLG